MTTEELDNIKEGDWVKCSINFLKFEDDTKHAYEKDACIQKIFIRKTDGEKFALVRFKNSCFGLLNVIKLNQIIEKYENYQE